MFLFIEGCKKERHLEGTSLIGTWELRHSSGGMMRPTSFPAGNGQIIQFEVDSFQYLRNGQVVFHDTYRLMTDSVVDINSCALLPPPSNAPNRIIYSSDPNSLKRFFELSGNTLKIMVGCMPLDGGVSIYRRIESNIQ
jgi:hypothetical protein